MDNQKDTKNNEIHSYGQSNVPALKSLINKPVYTYLNKKTEKLVTALYMVTDHMNGDDALKGKIRFLAVELLSDMYKLSTSSPLTNNTYITLSTTRVYEVLSFIYIAQTLSFISETNASILKKELQLLVSELEPKQSSENPFAFTLDDTMFDVGVPVREQISRGPSIKDRAFHINKRTDYMSFNKKPLVNRNSMTKDERTVKILNTIKDKKNLPGNDTGVSIKDISSTFPDYSEKTIQRELNSLVAKGIIKKIGAKRWSRYQ